ncbi:hypothetical protein PHYPSEUDO_000808 [Phytophthora pseudosyringae]|uniref:Uncharacterized protein n=1 Tax=Phytophthora pseudosyringae TaxID=221518 RepID=A0A8T1WK47_9STRA|nr:hypothetical protein PHYPSEUDO_000808 [Phytophthora pseudosyringae]
MAIGTTTSVKHNLKEDQPGQGAPVRGQPDTHLPPAAQEGEEGKTETPYSGGVRASEPDEGGQHKHQSHESCKSCGSLADKCSCKDCECQVCASKGKTAKQMEPAIKSATSSTVVCGGGCIAAGQRAAAGGCPGCECPAGGCPCTKCGCPICGPTQQASRPTPCCGGHEAGKRATGGTCPACGCPAGNCPCTNCKCPVCKSA